MAETVRTKFPAGCWWALDNPYREWFGTHEKVLRWAGLSAGMKVIDIGCGTGLITAALTRIVGARGHVIGVELSGAMLQRAQRRLGTTHNVSLVRADAGRLPFARRGHFDAVVLYYVMHEIPNRQAFLAQVGDLLKNGGRLLVVEPWIEVGPAMLKQEIEQVARSGFALIDRARTSKARNELLFGKAAFADQASA